MIEVPSYIGAFAFGVKMGVILSGDDLVEDVYKAVEKCNKDGLLENGDILCVTESIVARAQNNYVTKEEVAEEAKEKLGLTEKANLGILYPIASRNRFVPILESLGKAVPAGSVTIQFSFPRDCVGNQLVPEDLDVQLNRNLSAEEISFDELRRVEFHHPATGVDYVELYNKTVTKEGARCNIFMSNDPKRITKHRPEGIIVACIHEREKMLQEVRKVFDNAITLGELCSNPEKAAWSEWGLLGSNLDSDNRIKLAPRKSFEVAENIQSRIWHGIRKNVEVLVYGDGAYKDPSTGIYELADPVCSFGHTKGINIKRKGIKYKYFAGMLCSQGKNREEIEKCIETEKKKIFELDDDSMEGTTPRKLEDIAASLADLVSGSADAGTPLVIIKNLA